MASYEDLIGPLIGGIGGYFGSKGGNTTTQTSQVAPEFSPLASAVAQRGMDIGNMPYNPYTGSLTAGFNPYQNAGFDMTANRATQGYGLPQQSEQALSNVLSGASTGPDRYNPYADSVTSVGTNPYAGANPYLEQNIQNTLGDMTRSYNQNVAPSMAATAYKSGSFGNTGQAEMEAQSRNQLQQNLGRVSGDMRMQDYGMQQGLDESDIQRRANAQAADYSRNAGTYGQQNQLNQYGYEAGQSRLMQGLGYSPSIYGLGYQPAQQMLGIGGTMQQQGQNDLNAQYGQFQQAQNWPFKTYDAMLAPFSTRAVGGTQTTTAPGGNVAAGVLGGAMLGGQLFNGVNGSNTPTYNYNTYGQAANPFPYGSFGG